MKMWVGEASTEVGQKKKNTHTKANGEEYT